MKKIICFLSCVVILNFCVCKQAGANEISELKEQIEQMQKQMQSYQSEIQSLKQRINVLESGKAPSGKAPVETASADIAQRVDAIEEKLKQPYEGGLLSLKGEKWEIGGELEFEFVDTQDHAGADEPEPHFQLDKFVLKPKVHLNDHIFLLAEIEFYRTALETKKVYAQFNDMPYNSFIKIGIEERFMKPSRKTERYPLAGNAFWRDSEAGVFAGGEIKPLYWLFSYTSGFEIDQRAITEDNSLVMLHDNRKTSDYTSHGEFGGGIGVKHDFGSPGKIDLMGFGYYSKLSAADEVFLNTNLTGYDSGKRGQYRYGMNANYSVLNANLFAQFIKARDGSLDRRAWYIQPSYKINLADLFNKPDLKYFYCVEPLFRYGVLKLDIAQDIDDSLTWDREEFTFALLTDIYKNIKLKTEYTIDRMDKGRDGKQNYGEFVTQLEVKF